MRLILVMMLMPALAGCGGPSGTSVNSGSRETGENRAPIKVELLQPPSPIEAGTRAVFRFRITNVSTNAVDLPWPGYIDRFIHTDVRGPRGIAMHLQGKSGSLGHGKYPGGDILPGKSTQTELSCILTAAGDYTIRSYLETSRSGTPWTFWEGRVDAEDVVVTVLESKDDNKAIDGD